MCSTNNSLAMTKFSIKKENRRELFFVDRLHLFLRIKNIQIDNIIFLENDAHFISISKILFDLKEKTRCLSCA